MFFLVSQDKLDEKLNQRILHPLENLSISSYKHGFMRFVTFKIPHQSLDLGGLIRNHSHTLRAHGFLAGYQSPLSFHSFLLIRVKTISESRSSGFRNKRYLAGKLAPGLFGCKEEKIARRAFSRSIVPIRRHSVIVRAKLWAK